MLNPGKAHGTWDNSQLHEGPYDRTGKAQHRRETEGSQEESPERGLSSTERTSGWCQRQWQCKTWEQLNFCPGHCGTINQNYSRKKRQGRILHLGENGREMAESRALRSDG